MSHVVGNRAGKARAGCLLLILVVVAAVYFVADNAEVALDYIQLSHSMSVQAHFADHLTDDAIRAALVAKVDSLDLPAQARHFTIRRTVEPKEITISTSWETTLELPYYRYAITLSPVVREQL